MAAVVQSKDKYVMKYDVKHGDAGKVYDLPEGAECPPELLSQMKALKHVELYQEKPIVQAPTPKVSSRVVQPKPAPDAAEEDGDIEADKQK